VLQRILLTAAAAWLSLLTPRPEYRALFAPAGARGSAYEFYVSAASLEQVLRTMADDPALLHPPGAWRPVELLPSDAFGQTGRYDRAKLARLYGAVHPRVARGPSREDSWTLISPYPSADLARLEPGTLLIVLHLP
jgi:hypothetical protein